MTVVERCAAFAVGFAREPIPPVVAHHAKRALIDGTAALYPGAVVAPATLLEQAFADNLDDPKFRGRATLALGRTATAQVAALINGTAAHTVEVDDIFRDAIYHPGAPTIAAALAAAQDASRNGEAFLKAIIIGYEISCRIGQAMGKAHYQYWHNTGTIGTFGATAAAASLYGLDAPQFAHALATCTTFAAGLQQAFRMDSMSKPLHAGRAAEAGIIAARMAAAGVTGALDVIEGDAGFGRAMSNSPDWERALATLGRQFHITEMTFKNHACCGHAFAAIDGALIVQSELGITADQIKSVRVATYRAAVDVAGNPNPVTAAEARFSLPYVVATALVHGSVRLAAVTPARLACVTTRALMQRLTLTVDRAIDQGFPGARAARVEIITTDGRRATHLQPTRKGDPDQPLTDDELEAKYTELVTPVLGPAKTTALLRRLWLIDRAGTVRLA
jgi:2-methylcitrate dehydratase PrpD